MDASLAVSITRDDGGGTFDRRLRPVAFDRGYAIGLVGGTWRYCDRDDGDIAAVLRACLDECPDAPYVGTWVEQDVLGGLVHVDPVVVLQSRDDARTLGLALGQKAIWDFAAGAEIAIFAES